LSEDGLASPPESGDLHSTFARTAGLEHMRALVATRIIQILDERKLSARDAETLTVSLTQIFLAFATSGSAVSRSTADRHSASTGRGC